MEISDFCHQTTCLRNAEAANGQAELAALRQADCRQSTSKVLFPYMPVLGTFKAVTTASIALSGG